MKNDAIMVIGSSVVALRLYGKTTTEAIFAACRLRSRPITYVATAQAKLLANRREMAALNAL